MESLRECDTELLYQACCGDGLSYFDPMGDAFGAVDVWSRYLVRVEHGPLVQVGVPEPGLDDVELGYLAHAADFGST